MRETARRVYPWAIYVLAVAVVVQFLLAGLGIFTNAYFFFFHAVVNAPIIFFLPLIAVLIGWLGRVPGRMLALTAAVAGLTVLQSIFLIPYHIDGAPPWLRAISALHVLNALFIFWVALQLVDRTRTWAARPA